MVPSDSMLDIPCEPVFSAVWNCVFYNIKVYQTRILHDLPALIAAAHAKIDPRANIGGAPAILARLEIATKVSHGQLFCGS